MSQLLEELQIAIPRRYRVDQEVGRGGMATVFAADDLQFGRRVAIKVLNPDLASTLNAERFAREIRVLAQLNHPNILPVLDSGEANGLLYYVMPYIEGESLGAHLAREHQLAIEDAVALTCEIADALSYAHAAGVVHRDVKPENVLLSAGHAIVSDFGIARLLHDDGSGKITMTGISLGTAAYMSPEQSTGERVDARTDIYSLGCLAYELLVGAPPFSGPNPAALMARHAMEPPPSIRVVRPGVPEELEAAIMHALEKSPADRYRNVAEFKAALLGEATTTYTARYTARFPVNQLGGRDAGGRGHRMTGAIIALALAAGVYFLELGGVRGGRAEMRSDGEAGPPASSLAVLYFEDETADGSLRHVADGLTESLIHQLAEVSALRVISANGVRQLRGDVSPDSISRALGVGTLVRGRVSHAPGGVRVAVDILDAVSGAAFARRAMTFPLAELQVARDSVAEEVAAMLRTQLGNEVRIREQQHAASNAEAWTGVQRALKWQKDADSLARAGNPTDALRRLADADAALAAATRLDADWPEPLVRRAAVALSRARAAGRDSRAVDAVVTEGIAYADRALALDQRNAEAHEVRGQLLYYRFTQQPTASAAEAQRLLVEAESSLVRAVRLGTRRAGAWATLSALHYRKPDLQAAALAALNAYEADAYLENARSVIARLFVVSHDLEQYNEALKWCDTGRKRFPDDRYFVACRLHIMWMRPAEGQPPDSAWAYADEYVRLTPESRRPLAVKESRVMVAGALARAQAKDSARAVLRDARADAVLDPGRELAGLEAAVRVILGDHDEAVRLIQDYLTVNPGHRRGFATRTGWWWRDLQANPRFRSLLAGAR